MNLNAYFKSIIDQDHAPIVICDINHIIVYMNPSAVRVYENKGGSSLVGTCLLECHHPQCVFKITEVVHWFMKSENNNIIHTFYNEEQNKYVYMIALRDENNNLIGYYEKHEFRSKDDMPFYAF